MSCKVKVNIIFKGGARVTSEMMLEAFKEFTGPEACDCITLYDNKYIDMRQVQFMEILE